MAVSTIQSKTFLAMMYTAMTGYLRAIASALALIVVFYNTAPAQLLENVKPAQDLYFTYLGGTIGFGMHGIEYSGWTNGRQNETWINGSNYSAGAMIDIVADNLVGECTLQYQMITGSSEGTDQSMGGLLLTSVGKYRFNLTPTLGIAPGLGLYADLPPYSSSYTGGAGLLVTTGVLYKFDTDYIIIADLIFGYGTYGKGDESTRFSYGIKIGLVYSIGRI